MDRTRRLPHAFPGVELGIPVSLAEGLSQARAADLAHIEISPTGLGLHWPRLKASRANGKLGGRPRKVLPA